MVDLFALVTIHCQGWWPWLHFPFHPVHNVLYVCRPGNILPLIAHGHCQVHDINHIRSILLDMVHAVVMTL